MVLLSVLALLACKDQGADDTGIAVDQDRDGYFGDEDCDDLDDTIFPGAEEICDGEDNDCNGEVDEGEGIGEIFYVDLDGDGYGDDDSTITSCDTPANHVSQGGDCDDANRDIYPDAVDSCDSLDNDCDGTVDEDAGQPMATWYTDSDSDSFGDPASAEETCEPRSDQVQDATDCDDLDASRYPGATEVCGDGVVNDCDGDPLIAAAECGVGGELLVSDLDIALQPEGAADGIGGAFHGGADATGDGLDNLLVGAPGASNGDGFTGVVYLLTEPTGDVSLGSATARLLGPWDASSAGAAVAFVGDLDGDGLSEMAVGAPAFGGTAGGLFVASGGSTGDVDLGQDSWLQLLGTAGDAAGQAITAGDADGDGITDLLFSGVGTSGDGLVWLISAPATGSGSVSGADATLTGDSVDSAGQALAMVDVSGDGQLDLVIGAPGYAASGSGSGAVYVVHGPVVSASLVDADVRLLGGSSDRAGAWLSTAGDADGDGVDDLLIGSDSNDTAWLLSAAPAGEQSLDSEASTVFDGVGATSGAADFDLDGDGQGEVALGDISENSTYSFGGTVYVFYAPAAGSWGPADAELRIEGDSASQFVGGGLAAGGDLDGDGVDELVIGRLSGSGDAGWILQGLGI